MDPLSMATAGLGAIGSLFSGFMQSNADKAHAQALRNAAQQADDQAGVNAQEALQQGDETAAHAAVQGAANGGGFTGSTLGIIGSLGQQAMFNARAQVFRGMSEAQDDNYQAKIADANAGNAVISGVIGAGSSVVGGWAKSAFQKQEMGSLETLRHETYGGAPAYG